MGLSVLQIAYYPGLLETRRAMLEDDGYIVTSALGNNQGMDTASTARFDVIVVGFCASPSVRGSLVSWLKHRVPETPVVVLLAHAMERFPEADLATFSENPLDWLAAVRTACAQSPS